MCITTNIFNISTNRDMSYLSSGGRTEIPAFPTKGVSTIPPLSGCAVVASFRSTPISAQPGALRPRGPCSITRQAIKSKQSATKTQNPENTKNEARRHRHTRKPRFKPAPGVSRNAETEPAQLFSSIFLCCTWYSNQVAYHRARKIALKIRTREVREEYKENHV